MPRGHKGKTYEELYGKEKAEELKKRLSIKAKKQQTGSKNSFYGKHHSQETKEIFRNKRLGKTYEDLYVKERALDIKNKLGDIDIYYIYENIFRNDKNENNQTSLSDDLADIYRDLKYCISLYENNKNKKDSSIQDFWRLSFDTHWGKHILNFLNTMHIRLYDNEEE